MRIVGFYVRLSATVLKTNRLICNYYWFQVIRDLISEIPDGYEGTKTIIDYVVVKGQLISKCPFGVIVLTKIPMKNLTNFCPRIKSGEINKIKTLSYTYTALQNVLSVLVCMV